jgi:hypothetical protein
MARRLGLLIALSALVCAPAASAAPSLSIGKAKTVAAKKAEKVKRQMASEGARKAKVPGCWRNSDRQVSCFFSIYGYDTESEFDWQCMLRIVVALRKHPTAETGKYRITYGHAVCG